MVKKCKHCKEVKSVNSFYINGTSNDGYNTICRSCLNEKGDRRRRQNIDTDKKRFNRHNKYTYVYIVTVPNIIGFVKVGRSHDVDKRIAQYNTGTPFRDYQCVYKLYVSNIGEIEKYFLNKYGNKYSEWYNISIEQAISDIDSVAKY